jgi:hypothetical protein
MTDYRYWDKLDYDDAIDNVDKASGLDEYIHSQAKVERQKRKVQERTRQQTDKAAKYLTSKV